MDAQQRNNRLAWGFVTVGLLLAGTGIAYIKYADRPRYLPSQMLAPSGPAVSQLSALSRMLFISCLLLAVFVIGSYAMIRVGRLFIRRSTPARAGYVDAWSNYRLTEAELEAAGQQLDEAAGGEGSGDEEKPPT